MAVNCLKVHCNSAAAPLAVRRYANKTSASVAMIRRLFLWRRLNVRLYGDPDQVCGAKLQVRQAEGISVKLFSGRYRFHDVVHIFLTAGHLDVVAGEDAAGGGRDGIDDLAVSCQAG